MNSKPAYKTSDYICKHCRAFNAGFGDGPGRCGCTAARQERGEPAPSTLTVDDIELSTVEF